MEYTLNYLITIGSVGSDKKRWYQKFPISIFCILTYDSLFFNYLYTLLRLKESVATAWCGYNVKIELSQIPGSNRNAM